MLECERKIIFILSSLTIGGFFSIHGEGYSVLLICSLVVPLYFITIRAVGKCAESRERMDTAINSCIEESEFNVIDKIESLRNFFNNTDDVIEYLQVVESRLLSYVFDPVSLGLSYKDYISGAIKCLTVFKNYKGHIYFNIDVISISDQDKISTLLTTLYMVSKQIESGSSHIYITSRQQDDGVFIDVIDRFISVAEDDPYCKKMLTMFSSDQFVLTARVY